MSKDDLNKLTEKQMNTLPVFKVWPKLGIGSETGLRAWSLLMLRDLGYGFREAFPAMTNSFKGG